MSKGSKIVGAVLILLILMLPAAGFLLYRQAYYADHFAEDFDRFLRAAGTNNAEAVQRYLSSGTRVDAGQEQGITALIVASGTGSIKVVDLLVKNHANLEAPASFNNKVQNFMGRNTRHVGTDQDQISFTVEPGDTALVVAVREGLGSIVQRLLDGGAKTTGSKQFNEALRSAIMSSQDIPTLKLLLRRGFDFGTEPTTGQHLLHVLVQKADLALLKQQLLANPKEADALDKVGQTPLMLALTLKLKPEFTELLAQHTSNINVMSSSFSTPLHEALKLRYIKTARYLLEKGANPNLLDGASHTPLMAAVETGDITLVKLLLDHKADVNIKDTNGKSVVRLAEDQGKYEIAKVLNAALK